jgi:hypothetical protein
MKLSILTTITNPVERQDRFIEALQCYAEVADEVIVVNGGKKIVVLDDALSPKIKFVELKWPHEWNWIELPRHLNFGKAHCTGDWILRLDIDQFIHEEDIEELRKFLLTTHRDIDVVTLQKKTFTFNNRYYQKGEAEICIRNLPHLAYGKLRDKETDLCFPVHQNGTEEVFDEEGNMIYELPIGFHPKSKKSGITYWNYDYFFKDKETTRKEFWRFSRAWSRYFKNWNFGDSEEKSFEIFCKMVSARHKMTVEAIIDNHPKWIRATVKNITEDKLGHSGFGIL